MLGVITVCFATLDYLQTQFVQLVKVIRSMCYSVSMNTKKTQILQNSLLELSLSLLAYQFLLSYTTARITHSFLGRIRIIKPDEHLPFIHLRKVLIQNRSLQMSNVQIPRGLWWESGHDFAHFCVLEAEGERGGGLVFSFYLFFYCKNISKIWRG